MKPLQDQESQDIFKVDSYRVGPGGLSPGRPAGPPIAPPETPDVPGGCPVCRHTMQNLGVAGQRIFWCPRCGTLREYTGDFARVEQPLWILGVLRAAALCPKRQGTIQGRHVESSFKIEQRDLEEPRVELIVTDHSGRRVV